MNTPEGGQKVRETMYRLYGKDYYKNIGRIGGKRGKTGGFYRDTKRAKAMGSKGGKASIRGYRMIYKTPTERVYTNLSTGETIVKKIV